MRNYTLKVFKDDREVQRVETHNLSLFTRKSRLINWLESNLEVYLRVSEGSFNDGTYQNKKDFEIALKAFMEK